MDESALGRLRAEASREDYSSMARLASALYENGLSVPEVMRECYGVDMPMEFLVLAEADLWRPGLLVACTDQPWRLAVPPARGGPVAGSNPGPDGVERKLLALDPDLLPLGYTLGAKSPSWENKEVLCYRLSELAAGRPTVFRLREKTTRARDGAPNGRLGHRRWGGAPGGGTGTGRAGRGTAAHAHSARGAVSAARPVKAPLGEPAGAFDGD